MQTRDIGIRRYRERTDAFTELRDELAVEDYLEVFVEGEPYAVTMRLPGRDYDLAAGFCFSEGLIDSCDDILWMRHCDREAGENRILVLLADGERLEQSCGNKRRSFLSQSSCGVCGKTDFQEIHLQLEPVRDVSSFRAADLVRVGSDFENRMTVFPKTGCTHAAGIFTPDLRELDRAEDIGRHNALDKAVGACLRSGRLQEAALGIVSSRLSLEMVQKAVRAGLEVLAGVSAATTMAVELAARFNITLIGFLRDGRMNIYTHPHRITARNTSG
jgi:FdhD protein